MQVYKLVTPLGIFEDQARTLVEENVTFNWTIRGKWLDAMIVPNILSIIGGVIAGILGFTGFTGFVFYFLVHGYWDSGNRIRLEGFLGGLMTLVLFWTLAEDMVHIF
ncbi:hypothetical protein AAG906_013746 [Vitis piasezkii]